MHRFSLLAVLLAACLTTSIAVAANDKITAEFTALAASGVTGKAAVNPMKAGQTQIHGQLRGLTPNAEYVSLVYQESGDCTSGGVSTEVARFTENPSGGANFNQKIALDIASIRSISVQRVSDNAVQACASVSQ